MSKNDIINKQVVGLLYSSVGSLMVIITSFLNMPMHLTLIGTIVFLIGIFYFVKYRSHKKSFDTSEGMREGSK
jgi:hypothetical protein